MTANGSGICLAPVTGIQQRSVRMYDPFKSETAMRKFVILAFLTSAFALPAAAEEEALPVTVVPFEVLEGDTECSGPGKIAVRVAFDVKDTRVRFGRADRKGLSYTCEIKTRRGGDVTRIPIPCPAVGTTGSAPEKPLFGLPPVADLSGRIDVCLGVNDITFVKGTWKLQAATSSGNLTEVGDLSSAGLTLFFKGPESGLPATSGAADRADPPVLAIVWDRVGVALQTDTGERLDVSAYLALAPAKVQDGWCDEDHCRYWDTGAGQLVKSLGGRDADGVVDFVDGRRK